MKNVLVTGGLGFIGSNFIQYAHDKWQDSNIINVDVVSYGAVPENLAHLEGKPRYRFVKGDIADRELVKQLIDNVDTVINFAAETHVDRSISNPWSFLHSNVVGTFNLLEAARKSKVNKFIQISTDEVYGSASTGVSFREEDRLRCSSPYSASKAAADMFVEAYCKTYSLHTVTLRCTNNFGPRQFPEKFIPKTIISALLGRRVPVYGRGSQIREWTYVLDFCKAVALASENGRAGELYNVSSGNQFRNIQVATRVLDILGKPAELIEFVEDRPGHDYRYSLDSSRIRTELGWKPEHSFDEAMNETINWYIKNEAWWRTLITDSILSGTPWKEESESAAK